METENLMIGDWYLASKQHSTMDGDYELEFYPKKLTLDDLIFARENDWNELDWFEFTKPIPLTTDILEKNGFKLEEDGFNWYDGVHDTSQTYVNVAKRKSDGVRRIEILNERRHYCIDMCYEYTVNELQQALRLCDLNNLADSIII